MIFFVFILVSISVTRQSNAFFLRPMQLLSNINFRSDSRTRIMAIVPSSEKKNDSLMYDYFTTPRVLERTSILSILYGQGLLFCIGLASGIVFNIDALQLKTLVINSDSFIFGLIFAVPMLGTLRVSHANEYEKILNISLTSL